MVRLAWLFVLLLLPLGAAAQPGGEWRENAAGEAALRYAPTTLTALLLAPEAGGEFVPTPSFAGTSFPARSLEQRRKDPWLAFDKVQHLAFSFLWTLGSQYALVNKAGMSERAALPVSAGASAAVGFAKEYYDWRIGPHRYFSRRDLAADAVGILLAAGFVLL